MVTQNRRREIGHVTDEEKLLAVLSYIPFLCFIPFFKTNNGSFANKHLKQGLILLVIEIVALFFLIEVLSKIFWTIILVFCLTIACIGILTAFSGKEFKVPVIGNFFEKYDI